MYYYLYRITNLANNKMYVGIHKTADLNDGYMGSGKLLALAIKKYGIDNFQKEILEFFPNYKDALAKEKEIVNEEFLTRDDVYNLRRGGNGGFDYINKHKEQYREKRRRVGMANHFYGKRHTEETKKILAEKTSMYKKGVALSDSHKSNISNSLKGIKFTEERKQKISRAKIGKPAWNKGIQAEPWTCPHCGRQGSGASNKVRYHFDNCKAK
jgi:group I intron endonuclease